METMHCRSSKPRTKTGIESNSMRLKNSVETKMQSGCSLPLLVIPGPHPHRDNKKKRKCGEKEEEPAKRRCTRSLYSLSTGKVLDEDDEAVALPHKRFCRGSSFGWLVTFHRKDSTTTKKVKYYAQLHNPFGHNPTIHLPPLPLNGLVFPSCDEDLSSPLIYLRKAVLSSPPDNRNFVVLAILTGFRRLAFYDPTAKASFCWTPIGDWNEWKQFGDAIYSQKAQQFLAVKNDTGEVFSIRGLHRNNPYFTQVAPPVREDVPPHGRYIVESPKGELLQVFKDWEEQGQGQEEALIFHVFKFEGGEWIRLLNLEDTVLFLGSNASISRSASAFPGCILRPNSIYFTDDSDLEFESHCRFHAPPSMGIYNMEDGTVHPMLSPASSTICYGPQATAPIWLLPTLQGDDGN